MLVWLLCPSTPQACRKRSAKPSSPGRPTWYITSSRRPSTIAVPDPPGDVVERLVPATPAPTRRRRGLPMRRSGCRMRSGSLTWLIGRRSLRAVAPARAGVGRVALDLLDRQVLLVHVGEQAAGRLAVEAGRRDEHELARHLARVRLGVVLDEGVPLLRRREVAQVLVPALARQVVRRGGRPLGGHSVSFMTAGRPGRPARTRSRRRAAPPGRAAPRPATATSRVTAPRHGSQRPRRPREADAADPERPRVAARGDHVRGRGGMPGRVPAAVLQRQDDHVRGGRPATSVRTTRRSPAGSTSANGRATASAPAPTINAWTCRCQNSSGDCHRSRPSACPKRKPV